MIKPPLNYTGSKHKIAHQMAHHLPDKFDRVQCFFGGVLGDVVNLFNDKTEIWAFEICKPLVGILQAIKKDPDTFLDNTETVIKNYALTDINEQAYLYLRRAYNYYFRAQDSSMAAATLFALIAHSFNNYLRFNKKGEFNVPFGQRTLNPKMVENYWRYAKKLANPNLRIMPLGYQHAGVKRGDFILADPPYLTGVAPYGGWSGEDERQLLATLDAADKVGAKFMLINALENNGKVNPILKKWAPQYKVIPIHNNYRGASHHRGMGGTREILVCNYG